MFSFPFSFGSAFPKHDVEMLFLGSQKLTDLRDNITCSNDLSICEDLSPSPEFRHIAKIPNAAVSIGVILQESHVWDGVKRALNERVNVCGARNRSE